MDERVLSEFYDRFPSAFGNSRAGGVYRVICPQCGEFVPVLVSDENPRGIDVDCPACGWHDHVGPVDVAAG